MRISVIGVVQKHIASIKIPAHTYKSVHLWQVFRVDTQQTGRLGTAASLYVGHVVNAHKVTMPPVRLEAALWES